MSYTVFFFILTQETVTRETLTVLLLDQVVFQVLLQNNQSNSDTFGSYLSFKDHMIVIFSYKYLIVAYLEKSKDKDCS